MQTSIRQSPGNSPACRAFRQDPCCAFLAGDSELNRAVGSDDRRHRSVKRARRRRRQFFQGLIAPLSHQRRQMRWHCSGLQIEIDAKPLTDFLAERRVMGAADLDVASVRGISHEKSNGSGKRKNWERGYRRAVTRRASTIIVREAGLRKQEAS